MALSKKEFAAYIKKSQFRELFNEMGWDNDRTAFSITAEGQTFQVKAVAQKRSFKILQCTPAAGIIPDYALRRKIEDKVAKIHFEHIIIYTDERSKEQIWQSAKRQAGKPTKITEVLFEVSQAPELLYQKAAGLFIEEDDEEHITIVDITQRVADNFHQNTEKVTKQFYDRFKKEHTSFLQFIQGIEETTTREWYASLMLNRLMFCYFIQKKGFLDNNKNYLQDKLKLCRTKSGNGAFYSFYRNFLLVLFHKGLNEPGRLPELLQEIGKIPYLNGGLFDEHEIEKQYTIAIDDAAFERLFAFFDQYEWHLDTRITASGRDINPDVIGYIFEKYINDRAQMGAYYTKEDITEYIGKNCIIPYLFDETRRNYPKAFADDGELWKMVRNSGNTYIYNAVKHGISSETDERTPDLKNGNDTVWSDLPEDIRAGINPEQEHLVDLRKAWNKAAPADIALPTETYREVIDRRKRYYELLALIRNGGIQHINDCITYNLDIRQLAQDAIESTADPDFIRSFYKALCHVTILDPTCGSGAFLFAAMNILEPLYEACIMRMRAFVGDEDRKNYEEKNFSHKYKDFRKILEDIQNEHHPNLQYFIYKSIILQNLYGVDIMKEAVEIAKLRLFLKLVATVEADYRKPNLGLEPLPDIDFNIRAGNTLVGFATEEELKRGGRYTFDFDKSMPIIEEQCEKIAMTFRRYKEIQLSSGDDYYSFRQAKETLNNELRELNRNLNVLLHKQTPSIKYQTWLDNYQPFHWFAEFYEIIHDKGGFDVIIGNPPYVVYTPSSFEYEVKNYNTLTCANLYAFCCEKSFTIMNQKGKFGMIIPNSSISADKLEPLQKLFIRNKCTWISNYAWRPAKLFEGANMLLAIVLSSRSTELNVFTSIYYKWYNEFRDSLLDNITYQKATEIVQKGSIPKIPSSIIFSIYDKLRLKSGKSIILNFFVNKPTSYKFYYFRAVLYWVKILENEPIFREDGIQTTTGEMKTVFVNSEEAKYIFISLLSSSLYFLHYITWSSCQVINSRDFELPFNLEKLDASLKLKLVTLAQALQTDINVNSSINVRNYSAKGRIFTMEKQYFYIKKSKPIIDEIDKVLGEHYGFTSEELDFIINYDIKYRMGKELGGEEEE